MNLCILEGKIRLSLTNAYQKGQKQWSYIKINCHSVSAIFRNWAKTETWRKCKKVWLDSAKSNPHWNEMFFRSFAHNPTIYSFLFFHELWKFYYQVTETDWIVWQEANTTGVKWNLIPIDPDHGTDKVNCTLINGANRRERI